MRFEFKRASFVVSVLSVIALTGCTTVRETDPARTATEQLLISAAADRAAEKLVFNIPQNSKVFINADNFEGLDGKYAIGSIRDHVLRQGFAITDNKNDADTIVEIRAGALSIDKQEVLVGIPNFDIPIPLAGQFTFPEIALFKREEQLGVAKFAATSYDAKKGTLENSTSPQFGGSEHSKTVLLFLISWSNDNLHATTQPVSRSSN
ncbi:DUF6655 family protein [Dongia soli]|uniref:DUF6655 family protein n=1 Tax=Dongia soli TaxID=600628 RepID=A0ABU5ED24_9PROT|nr:DUF6655 family protein [Dongia soli]MDY0883338.1 DUF6655 family protein [Dongia soli]